MRKRCAKPIVVLIVGALLAACAPGPRNADVPSADMVLRHGKIITVDQAFSTREAIAIRGERILAVGTDAEIERYVGANTRVVDLGGRAVIPGLIDSHLHSAGGGPGVDLANTRT